MNNQDDSNSSSSGSENTRSRASQRKKHNLKKRFAPKVRTGCLTCRSRRVKCDEARPSCLRCRKAEYVCEYASDGLNIVLAKEVHQLSASFPVRTSPLPKLPQPIGPSYGSGEESRYLATFLSLSAPWFARYHSPEFFHVILPQTSWHHPALRHALVAVAMASEQQRCPDIQTKPHRRNWHYSQALLHMHQDRVIPEDVALLTSVLFWLHDNITNNSRTAMVHLHGFLKIIIERKSRKPNVQSKEVSLEDTILRGLVYNANIADPTFAEVLAPELVQEVRKRLSDINYLHSFTTMDAVRKELNVGLSAMQFGTDSVRGARDDSKNITYNELRKYFERWHRAFSNVPSISEADEILLECHYINAVLAIHIHEKGGSVPRLDDPQSVARFHYVLDRIESLDLESMEQAPLAKDVELPIIPALCGIIRMAGVFRIRMRAFHLLRCIKRTEGLWNSDVSADMMEAATGMTRLHADDRLSVSTVTTAIETMDHSSGGTNKQGYNFNKSHCRPMSVESRESVFVSV